MLLPKWILGFGIIDQHDMSLEFKIHRIYDITVLKIHDRILLQYYQEFIIRIYEKIYIMNS